MQIRSDSDYGRLHPHGEFGASAFPCYKSARHNILAQCSRTKAVAGGGKSSLFSCLLDEVFAVLSARSVHVWEIGTNLEPRLLWQVGQGEGVQDHAQQAVLGQVNRVSHVSDT